MHHANRSLVLLFVVATATACGGRPYTNELAQLDALMNSRAVEDMRVDLDAIDDLNVRELREKSIELLEAAEVNYRYAAEAWKNRKDSQANEFTRVGLIYFNAAENYARSAEARLRLSEANARHQQQRERRNLYSDMLGSETELIDLLDTIQVLFERNTALRRELATQEAQFQSEARAVYSMQEARILQREAEGVKAPQFASNAFAEANASLARAEQHYQEGDYDQSYDIALRSMEQYRLAIEAARPNYLAEQDMVLNNPETRAIYEDAQRTFGAQLAFIDARGIVVVVPALFERGSSSFRQDRVYLLDQVVEVLRNNEVRSIVIEGHTQDRGANETNMALSGSRAETVKEYVSQRGYRGSRINTTGLGEEAPRFDNRTEAGRADNDRVEVIFVIR